jgi:hypothetical protein
VSQCDLAVPIDEVLSVSLCLRESQEPSASQRPSSPAEQAPAAELRSNPARACPTRVTVVVRSQGNDLTETQRHGEERDCQRDAGRLRSVRRDESPMEIFGPIRSSRASVSQCDLAVPIDEVLSVSLCLRESQEPSRASRPSISRAAQRPVLGESGMNRPNTGRSFALREMISRRHRGTERNATVSATLVVYVRCEEAKVRWRFSGLFDRRGQACLNAIWLFQSMKFSPCLRVSGESQEPSASQAVAHQRAGPAAGSRSNPA